MGAIWKFFSGEDDATPAPDPPEPHTSIWGFFTGEFAERTPPPHVAAAYHEAGHARAARIAKATVTGMSVDAHGSGLTEWERRSGLSDRELRAMLVAIVAGQESECRYLMDRCGYSYKAALRATHSAASDDREIFKRAAEGTGYTFEGLRGEAHRLVRWHAYTIETNAKPLARRGRRGGTWA